MSTLDLFIPSKAPSHRQAKVAENIKDILATICAHGDFPPAEDENQKTLRLTESISITKVDISPDLQHVTAYFMTLGGKNLEFAEQFLNALQSYFRYKMAKKLTMKYTPEIYFSIDKGYDAQDRINSILNIV